MYAKIFVASRKVFCDNIRSVDWLVGNKRGSLHAQSNGPFLNVVRQSSQTVMHQATKRRHQERCIKQNIRSHINILKAHACFLSKLQFHINTHRRLTLGEWIFACDSEPHIHIIAHVFVCVCVRTRAARVCVRARAHNRMHMARTYTTTPPRCLHAIHRSSSQEILHPKATPPNPTAETDAFRPTLESRNAKTTRTHPKRRQCIILLLLVVLLGLFLSVLVGRCHTQL